MNSHTKVTAVGALVVSATLLLAACASRAPASGPGGTAWGVGAFDSNGERIYFTATSDRGTTITYTGGPATGMMMGGGYLTCATCHGPDGRGGVHTMTGMQTMNAPDIRWSVLAGDIEGEHGGESEDVHRSADYNLETFRLAVADGKHPDGTSLSLNMPRWTMSAEDTAEVVDYLKTLP